MSTPTSGPLRVGTEAWFARRAVLWREDAEALVKGLREYEECHPPVRDGVACFHAALEAAEAALTAAASPVTAAPAPSQRDHPSGSAPSLHRFLDGEKQ